MTKRNLLQRLLDERAGAERDGWQQLEERLAPVPRPRQWVLAPIGLVVAVLLAVQWVPRAKPVTPVGREALHIFISRSDHPALEVTLRAER